MDVSAADNVGVTQVALYIDGALFATDPTEPYSFAWDTTKSSNGTHTLQVVASDAAGNSGASAAVSVTSGPSPCTEANPTVTPSPVSLMLTPGTSASYTITVTNTDSTSCPASTFALQATVPSGWPEATFAPATLPLSPGASGSTTLTVTVPSSATAGSYTIPVTATNSTAPTYVALTSVTTVLFTSLDVTVKTDKSTYPNSNSSVLITASVSGGGSPVAGASVTFTITKPGGSTLTLPPVTPVTTNGAGSASYKWTDKQKASGTYTVLAVATWKNGVSGSSPS